MNLNPYFFLWSFYEILILITINFKENRFSLLFVLFLYKYYFIIIFNIIYYINYCLKLLSNNQNKNKNIQKNRQYITIFLLLYYFESISKNQIFIISKQILKLINEQLNIANINCFYLQYSKHLFYLWLLPIKYLLL